MMKNFITINNPCPENWDSMQDSSQGKFCEKCSKCVIDFTDKTDREIANIFTEVHNTEICGKISKKSLSKIASGIILITNLTFIQAQNTTDLGIIAEQKASYITKLSGKLIFKTTKKEIINAEVFFISKTKYIKANTDAMGNFVLEIPSNLVEQKNVLYFDFDKLNRETEENPNRKSPNIMGGDIFENTAIIFTKNEKISDKQFQIDSKKYYLGGVAFTTVNPQDYYYFNGKRLSKRKFEKLKKENPNYQYFFFDSKEAEAIINRNYLNSLQLLYSD